MKFWLLFFLLSPSVFALSPKPAIGEPNFLDMRYGIWTQLFNNDYLGGTDKLMTGNVSLGYFDKDWGFYFDQRLITKIHKTAYNTRPLDAPIGFNADVQSFNFIKAWNFEKNEFLIMTGLDRLGDHGAQDFADNLHQVIGGSSQAQPEGDLKKGDFLNYNIQLKRQSSTFNPLSYGVGIRNDFLLREYYGFYNVKLQGQIFGLGLGQYVAYHENSRMYNVNPYRIESTLGLSIGKYYSLFIHYLPSYVKEDNRNQLYFSPLNFQYEW